MPLSARARRWTWIAAALAVLALLLAWWVDRQLEPQRLARTVLGRAGPALQLDLRFEGTPDYALRPEPRLRLPNFSARLPDGRVLLAARRLEVSLPWSTLTGGEPVITRVELDAPRLDLAVLDAWMASRPETPFKVYTLEKGLAVTEGTVQGEGWQVSALALDLPTLAQGQPANLQARGRFRRGEVLLGFDGKLDLAHAAQRSAFSLQAGLGWVRKPQPLKVAVTLRGDFDLTQATRLTLAAMQVKADSPLPSFQGAGKLVSDKSLAMDFALRLTDWPKDWPALPGTLAGKGADLPVTLAYRGDKDFGGPLVLHAQREDTVLDASLRVPEVLDWFQQPEGGLLPPLAATLRAPSLAFDGVTLEGVQMELSEDEPAAAP